MLVTPPGPWQREVSLDAARKLHAAKAYRPAPHLRAP